MGLVLVIIFLFRFIYQNSRSGKSTITKKLLDANAIIAIITNLEIFKNSHYSHSLIIENSIWHYNYCPFPINFYSVCILCQKIIYEKDI